MPAPFHGKRFTFTQPDGSTIELRGFGNQFRARFETLDGSPAIKDPATGFYRLASVDASENALGVAGITQEGDIQGSERAAEAQPGLAWGKTRWQERLEEKKSGMRAAAEENAALAAPERETLGEFVGLCLLIEFPDVRQTIPQDEVEAFCNRRGYDGFGNNGSVFDYFLDNSAGRLRYTNIVAPYYRSRHPREHYTDPTVHWPDRTRELILEALDHHKSRGFDFSGLTTDSEGFVRALNVFYVGEVVNEFQKGLWPHSSSLLAPFELSQGVKARDYQVTDMGHKLTLGTFCHENGHMICDFPDLYDLGDPGDKVTDSYGTGFFCLMGYGGDADPANPAQVCAYLKRRAGWTDRLTQITPGLEVTLDAGRNDFAIFEKSPTEYFIFEARLQAGRDAALPDGGLAIWHVDERGSNEHEHMTPRFHYECSLEQADGRFDLEKAKDAGDRDDLFPCKLNNRFGNASQPDSKWWDGTSSGLEIRRIRRDGTAMTFVSE
jgi:M6 family metalloprotease-like protein